MDYSCLEIKRTPKKRHYLYFKQKPLPHFRSHEGDFIQSGKDD